MAERPGQLNLSTLAQLQERFVPLLSPDDSIQFGRRATVFSRCFDTVTALVDIKNQQLHETESILSQPQESATLAQRRLDLAREQISQASDLRVIWGNIQVALYEKQQFLPFYLRPFKKFARAEHPYLTIPRQEAMLANSNLEKALEQSKKEKELISLQYERKINEERRKLTQVKNRLLIFCDNKAGFDMTRLEIYLGLLPERADSATLEFARAHALDQQYHDRYTGFLNGTRRTAIDTDRLSKETYGAWVKWLANSIKQDLLG